MAPQMPKANLNDVHIAILAGGSGTRLWPHSREARPKQLQSLVGDESMLQRTVKRVLPLVPHERIHILTGPEHAHAIASQLPDIPRESIFIEPSPCGTGPALGLAAVRLRSRYPGHTLMMSLHADHAIKQEESFREALVAAVNTARRGHLVTVGIVPSYPETGFGYIERGQFLVREGGLRVFRVARFTEKPPLPKAEEFVASGRFYWNAGYFAWTLDNIIEEFQRLLPETYARLDAMVGATDAAAAQRIWEQVRPVTIDVGIMEAARKVAVVPCEMGWSDVGSWEALHGILPRDAQENVVLGSGKHVGIGTTNSLVYSDTRLVTTIGLDDVVIVDTEDALLVMPKKRAQEVSGLVKSLCARGLEDYL